MNPAVLSLVATVSAAATTLTPARTLLKNLFTQLPQQPIVLKGELKSARGIRARTFKVQMDLNWGGNPAIARYSIRDRNNTDLEQLTVIRHKNRKPEFKYAKGDPLVDALTPRLFQPVQGTDVSWADISLMFLWWDNPRTVKTDTVKGRPCFVVEVPGPKDMSGAYARTVLWIDQQFHMLLKAEGYDAEGKLIRRMSVRSFKKMKEQWMIKDIDIESFPSTHKTRLRIQAIEEVVPAVPDE